MVRLRKNNMPQQFHGEALHAVCPWYATIKKKHKIFWLHFQNQFSISNLRGTKIRDFKLPPLALEQTIITALSQLLSQVGYRQGAL